MTTKPTPSLFTLPYDHDPYMATNPRTNPACQPRVPREEEGCSSVIGTEEVDRMIEAIFGPGWQEERGATAANNKLMRAVDDLAEKKKRFDVNQFVR